MHFWNAILKHAVFAHGRQIEPSSGLMLHDVPVPDSSVRTIDPTFPPHKELTGYIAQK